MVFSSLIFTFLFLPVTLGLYYLAKEPYRNYLLLAASLLFYAYGEPRFVFVMVGSIAVNYGLALGITDARAAGRPRLARAAFVIAIAANLGLLFVFKYLGFAARLVNGLPGLALPVPQIALPIGISFFTFQALSYVIDVWRGTVPVQKNPFYLALYISFFPQLIAGPIVRYASVEEQLRSRRTTPALFAAGVDRFFLGFGKKVLLANNLALVAQAAFDLGPAVTGANPLLLWLGSVCYTLQIYYDFSGYSDMAIGLGRMFGFQFNENFNYPYIARSMRGFWDRWHISLSTWLEDYLFTPLVWMDTEKLTHGRRQHLPVEFCLLVTFFCSGLWHGAAWKFIAWGLWNGAFVVMERKFLKEQLNRLPRWVQHTYTLLCVLLGMTIFNAQSLANGLRYCLALFGVYGVPAAWDAQVQGLWREYGVFIALGIVCATPLLRRLGEWADGRPGPGTVRAALRPLAYGAMFLWAVSFLILGAHNPFLYFNF